MLRAMSGILGGSGVTDPAEVRPMGRTSNLRQSNDTMPDKRQGNRETGGDDHLGA